MTTISSYTGDGETTQFDITFTYRDDATVKARLDGVDTEDFVFINPSRIEFDVAPAANVLVELYRQTPVTPAWVEFQDGAIIRGEDLNNSIAQPRERLEELEAELDVLNERVLDVTNVGKVTRAELASSAADSGAEMVGWVSDVTGPVSESVSDVLRRFPVFPETMGSPVTAALMNSLIAQLHSQGGGRIMLKRGASYTFTETIPLLENVLVDVNGADVTFNLTDSIGRGFVLHSGAHLMGPGTVHTAMSGSPSAQGIVGAPVSVGNPYGSAGTPVAPAAGEGATNWSVRGLTLSSSKGTGAVVVYGGARNGLIENITVPDSTTLLGGVLMDWNYQGTLYSQPQDPPLPGRETILLNMQANRTDFDNGDALTTHPNNIVVRGLTIGNLSFPATGGTDVGTWGVRLSGAYNILVEAVVIKSVTYSAIQLHSGDLGAEFASAEEKPFIGKNQIVRSVAVLNAGDARLVWTDSYADNLANAIADTYSALTDPLIEVNTVFDNIVGQGSGLSTAKEAFRINDQRGGVVRGLTARGFKQGILVDQRVSRFRIERPTIAMSYENGIEIEHPTYPPEDIMVVEPLLERNGVNTGYSYPAGLRIGTSKRVTVQGGQYGAEGEFDPTQYVGIRVMAGALDTVIRDPYIRSAKQTDGYGMIILSGSGYNAFGLLENVRWDPTYLSNRYGGLDCVPVARPFYPGGGGQLLTEYVTNAGNTLEGLTLKQGDKIWYGDPSAGASPGLVAVSSATVSGNLATLTRAMPALPA